MGGVDHVGRATGGRPQPTVRGDDTPIMANVGIKFERTGKRGCHKPVLGAFESIWATDPAHIIATQKLAEQTAGAAFLDQRAMNSANPSAFQIFVRCVIART